MDSKWISLLDSPIASDRERAVKGMAQSRDEAYIPYLNAFARTESDEALRTLAQKAIRYIERENAAPAPGAAPVQRVEVPAGQVRRAADMLNRALDLSTKRQDDDARDLAGKAYHLNPNIRLDAYQRGIVGTVFGVSPDAAFELLDSGAFVPRGEKPKRKTKHDGAEEDATWGAALMDLGIYALVIIVSMIVLYFLVIQFARPLLIDLAQTAAQQAQLTDPDAARQLEALDLATIVNGVLGAGVVVVVLNAVLTGLLSAFITLVFSFCVHLAAGMLGGIGTLPRLLTRTVPLYTGFYVVSLLIVVFGGLIALNDLAAALAMAAPAAGAVESALARSPAAAVFYFGNIIAWIAFWVLLAARTASAYDFSWLRGCFSQLLGSVVMMMATCGCLFILTNLIGASIVSLLV